MNDTIVTEIRRKLRPIPDFPRPGIMFQDITLVLRDEVLFRQSLELMAEPFQRAGITHVAAIEARGFIFGAPLAVQLGAGFIPLRKPGKLPWERLTETYALEYGTDGLESHRDASDAGGRILVVDDVLATGGTAQAAGRLVRRLGAELVGWSFLLAIDALGGASRLAGAPAHWVVAV